MHIIFEVVWQLSPPRPPTSRSWWNEGEAFDFQVVMNFNNYNNNLMVRCLTFFLRLDREYSNMPGVVDLSSGSQQQSNRQPPPSNCCSISWVDRSIQYFLQQIVHILNAKFWVVHVIVFPYCKDKTHQHGFKVVGNWIVATSVYNYG